MLEPRSRNERIVAISCGDASISMAFGIPQRECLIKPFSQRSFFVRDNDLPGCFEVPCSGYLMIIPLFAKWPAPRHHNLASPLFTALFRPELRPAS